jgi:hypothetical protein
VRSENAECTQHAARRSPKHLTHSGEAFSIFLDIGTPQSLLWSPWDGRKVGRHTVRRHKNVTWRAATSPEGWSNNTRPSTHRHLQLAAQLGAGCLHLDGVRAGAHGRLGRLGHQALAGHGGGRGQHTADRAQLLPGQSVRPIRTCRLRAPRSQTANRRSRGEMGDAGLSGGVRGYASAERATPHVTSRIPGSSATGLGERRADSVTSARG